MTTTIDTDGRATGDTTPTRVLDLKTGDIIQTSWDHDDMAEVLLATPVEAAPDAVLLVMLGGYFEQTGGATMYQVVTGDRADRWRADRDATIRRNRFSDQLHELAHQFAVRDLPMPSPALGAHLTVYMDSTGDVEQAAKTLGAEIERTDHAVAAVLPDVGDSDLSVRFQRYLRPEVDA